MKIRVNVKRLVWVLDTYEYDVPDELQPHEIEDYASRSVFDQDPQASEIGPSPDDDDVTITLVTVIR